MLVQALKRVRWDVSRVSRSGLTTSGESQPKLEKPVRKREGFFKSFERMLEQQMDLAVRDLDR